MHFLCGFCFFVLYVCGAIKQLKKITMKKTIETISEKLTIPFCIIFFLYLMFHLAKLLINANV
jgi:hypothetical protein